MNENQQTTNQTAKTDKPMTVEQQAPKLVVEETKKVEKESVVHEDVPVRGVCCKEGQEQTAQALTEQVAEGGSGCVGQQVEKCTESCQQVGLEKAEKAPIQIGKDSMPPVEIQEHMVNQACCEGEDAQAPTECLGEMTIDVDHLPKTTGPIEMNTECQVKSCEEVPECDIKRTGIDTLGKPKKYSTDPSCMPPCTEHPSTTLQCDPVDGTTCHTIPSAVQTTMPQPSGCTKAVEEKCTEELRCTEEVKCKEKCTEEMNCTEEMKCEEKCTEEKCTEEKKCTEEEVCKEKCTEEMCTEVKLCQQMCEKMCTEEMGTEEKKCDELMKCTEEQCKDMRKSTEQKCDELMKCTGEKCDEMMHSVEQKCEEKCEKMMQCCQQESECQPEECCQQQSKPLAKECLSETVPEQCPPCPKSIEGDCKSEPMTLESEQGKAEKQCETTDSPAGETEKTETGKKAKKGKGKKN